MSRIYWFQNWKRVGTFASHEPPVWKQLAADANEVKADITPGLDGKKKINKQVKK